MSDKPTWQDIDERLGRIARLTAEAKRMDAEVEQAKRCVTDVWEPKVKTVKNDLATEQKALERDVKTMKTTLGKKRSRDLTHGRVFFRKTPSRLVTIAKETWAQVAERFQHSKTLRRFVNQTPTVDKEALKALSTDELEAAGLKTKSDDKFGYEVHEQPIRSAEVA